MGNAAAITARSQKAHAKVTNDVFALAQIDGRSAQGKRYRDIIDGVVSEFGSAELSLVREVAGLRYVIEREQAALITDEERSPENLVRLQNVCSRKERELRLRARRTSAAAAPAPGSGLRDRLAAKYREAGP